MFNVVAWNALDWVLVLILALSTARACMRGVVKAFFGLLGFVGGFELASWNYVFVGNWIYRRDWMQSLAAARILAFLVIAVVVATVFQLTGRGMKRTAHAIGLGLIDRLLGGVFGLARGVLIGVALIVCVSAFGTRAGWIDKSKLSPLFLNLARDMSFAVPHTLH